MTASLLFVAAAYLLGSVSFAVVASAVFRLPDPHSYGSGNPGATNVLRTGNKAAAVVTLLGDALKGWLAVWLTGRLGGAFAVADWTVPAVALAAFVGHLYPVFHGFAGGKGVATAAGLVTAALMPIGMFYLQGNTLIAWTMLPIAVLLFWRHRNNIRQLLAGSERAIGR